jgi:hypothetical protein
MMTLSFAGVFAQGRVEESWVREFSSGVPGGLDLAQAMVTDASGNVYVIGRSIDSTFSSDYLTLKYDANGDLQWAARYNGPGNGDDYPNAIVVDDSGNVYVTGESAAPGGFTDYATIKYDRDGNELWVARFNGPANFNDGAKAIAVDGEGNVYVTGRAMADMFSPDFTTIKYDPDGNEIWVAWYDGPGKYFDEANAIRVDENGNVYVTGLSTGSGSGADFATIKYSSDGQEQWVARYDGPGNSVDFAVAMAIDELGNVYVTGVSLGSGTSSDFATIKYDKDGVEQWVSRFNGTENSEDEARDLAVDGSGNVYVTGTSNGPVFDPNRDFITVKYNDAGVEEWVARYNGPGDDWDDARAIALDGSANVYVTGQSVGDGSRADYATVKYTSAGVEEWVVRFNSPVSKSDGAIDIQVDDSGSVYVTGTTEIAMRGSKITTIKYTQPSNPVVTAPRMPRLSSPPDAATDQPTTVTLRWDAVEGAVSYHLQVASDSLFASMVLNDSSLTNNSREVNALANDATYYWRVRAKNDAGYGDFSPTWSFSTAPAPPASSVLAAPGLSSPPNGATDVSTSVMLRWNAVDGATSYRLQVAEDSSFKTLVLDDATITVTSREVAALAHDSDYYWRVKASNDASSSSWSEQWSFRTVMAPPAEVELVSPEEAAIIAADTVRFVWKESDPSVVRYWFEMATDSSFASAMVDSSLTSTTKVVVSLDNETYWWRVRAKNEAGWGKFSSPRSFSRTVITGIAAQSDIPKQFQLFQNYPNPFNPTTTIRYTLASRSRVRLEVLNALGQTVAILVDAVQTASDHWVEWKANVPSGIYYYRMEAISLENPEERFVQIRKMVLLR